MISVEVDDRDRQSPIAKRTFAARPIGCRARHLDAGLADNVLPDVEQV